MLRNTYKCTISGAIRMREWGPTRGFLSLFSEWEWKNPKTGVVWGEHGNRVGCRDTRGHLLLKYSDYKTALYFVLHYSPFLFLYPAKKKKTHELLCYIASSSLYGLPLFFGYGAETQGCFKGFFTFFFSIRSLLYGVCTTPPDFLLKKKNLFSPLGRAGTGQI